MEDIPDASFLLPEPIAVPTPMPTGIPMEPFMPEEPIDLFEFPEMPIL
jgi:hypothetical protein